MRHCVKLHNLWQLECVIFIAIESTYYLLLAFRAPCRIRGNFYNALMFWWVTLLFIVDRLEAKTGQIFVLIPNKVNFSISSSMTLSLLLLLTGSKYAPSCFWTQIFLVLALSFPVNVTLTSTSLFYSFPLFCKTFENNLKEVKTSRRKYWSWGISYKWNKGQCAFGT